MKINIVYERNSDVDAPCWAKTEYQGQTIYAIGKTWEESKTRLLAKIKSWVNANVPPPETVEVESKDEEMETEFFPFKAGSVTREIEAGKV